jgi:hypothetical protein
MSGRRMELSATQLTASVLAAVTAAVAASYLGVAGTIIGAGVVSFATTAGTAIYRHYLARTEERLRAAASQLPQGARPGKGQRPGPAGQREPGPGPGRQRRCAGRQPARDVGRSPGRGAERERREGGASRAARPRGDQRGDRPARGGQARAAPLGGLGGTRGRGLPADDGRYHGVRGGDGQATERDRLERARLRHDDRGRGDRAHRLGPRHHPPGEPSVGAGDRAGHAERHAVHHAIGRAHHRARHTDSVPDGDGALPGRVRRRAVTHRFRLTPHAADGRSAGRPRRSGRGRPRPRSGRRGWGRG